jgi:hypothetical protein
MDDMDDPDERDLRRRLLARRLVSHRARTQTIHDFTGYSRHRLNALRQRWGAFSEDRHRGPAPSSLAEFFRTTKAIQAATAAALLCSLLGVTSSMSTNARRRALNIALGEQLCDVYEALQTSFPHLEIEFEHLMLLAYALADGVTLQLGHCKHCGAAILIDVLAAKASVCKPACQIPGEHADSPRHQDVG